MQYYEGDGDDTIFGAGYRTTLQISGSYSTVANGNDIVVQVGNGSMTFKDSADNMYQNGFFTITDAPAKITNPTAENSTSQPAESSTSQSAETNNLQADNNIYTYSGGNKNITNYAGEKINYSTDFTGLGFNGTDFILNSSTGSLTIKNALNKILDVAVGGNTVAYAFMGNIGGKLDGSSFSVLEVIIGGNNLSNEIFAGSGGSSLWGGSGGDDILTGGAGQDNFFFGKSDGADIINNAGSSDVVNLYDVSLSDIISADISGSQISVTFNTGNHLQVNSAENLSATFKLADGNWKFNHSSGQWQNA